MDTIQTELSVAKQLLLDLRQTESPTVVYWIGQALPYIELIRLAEEAQSGS